MTLICLSWPESGCVIAHWLVKCFLNQSRCCSGQLLCPLFKLPPYFFYVTFHTIALELSQRPAGPSVQTWASTVRMQTSLHTSALTFFFGNFIQLLNQLLPDEKEKVTLYKLHCISNGRSGLAVSTAICGGCYRRACSLSLALTLPGQISGGAGRFLVGLICPVRSPVPGRRASGHENGGEVVRRRSSRHALDF